MAEGERKSIVVLTVPVGRFVWWPGLSLMDFVPKGRRMATGTISLSRADDNVAGALKRAAREVAQFPHFYGG